VAVREADGRVIFLRTLQEGGAEHSFGIHVAEMAGMPPSIVRRAAQVLRQLEADSAQVYSHADGKAETADDGTGQSQAVRIQRQPSPSTAAIGQPAGTQLSLFQLDDPTLSSLRARLEGADLNNMTPLQAFDMLRDMKKELGI
jgi:DNA mismatch repair protein MutS